MADLKPHLFINNPRGVKKHFDATRGRNDDIEEQIQKSPQSYTQLKLKLNSCLLSYLSGRDKRIGERDLNVPEHLEYILVDFFVIFGNNNEFKTKDVFYKKFGLQPVTFLNFNQSVLFAITDEKKFDFFKTILNEFIKSPNNVLPSGKEYAISTIIQNFKFLSTEELLVGSPKEDVILSLINPVNDIKKSYEIIYSKLLDYIKDLQKTNPTLEFDTDSFSSLEIKNIKDEDVLKIAKNFDIIFKIQSLRVPSIKENEYSQPYLSWDFSVSPPANKEIIIGIIDNGVKPIKPIENVVLDFGFDITNKVAPNSLSSSDPHGTVVATLAALGLDYFNTDKKAFVADAFIVPIKILNFNDGYFNIYDIEKTIVKAIEKGVKIFNLSVCGPTKNYNSSISEFAYLLDRISYKYDIVIFIATGNLELDSVLAMKADIDSGIHVDFHTYPNHFYNPNKLSDSHACECTNLCMPGESFNNITVGAIADNMIKDTLSDLSLDKELPAYYSKKHYLDYTQKINGTPFSRSQKNSNINKPDIVMPGGDLLDSSSKMQVPGFGLAGNDFYYRECGTSFASPLAANIAAKILNLYPSLNMQSVKALMLNGSERLLKEEFLDDLIKVIKEEESNKEFGKEYSLLTKTEKRKLSANLIDSGGLYRKLVGYGKPLVDKILYSSSKSVTTIIQDNINTNSYKVLNLNIPDYLLNYSKANPILNLKATLCFKIYPQWNEHLGYNPLHISFNFTKSLVKNDPAKTSDIISNRKHLYYNDFYSPPTGNKTIDDKMRLNARSKAVGIKSNLESWSEDFSPLSSKPFSNTQVLELKINKKEINKIDKQLSVVVRCTSKRDLEPSFMEWINETPHEFSISLNISEKENDELTEYSLYDELINSNDLEQIVNIDTNLDIDLGI